MTRFPCLIIFVSVWPIAFAKALSPKEVVRSSLKHYPQVIESVLEVEKREGDLRESRGAFDARVKGEADARTDGFYSGDHYKGQVEKAFPFLNSRVYGGLRNGFGSFPDYEGKYQTLSQGESFAGVGVSLLRNAMIDLNRYKVRVLEQDKIQAEIELDRVKLAVQTLALQAYWNWLVKGYQLRVYQEILSLAQQRVTQIERRIKVGDLARIFKAENDQYIRSREANVLKGQMDFLKASYYLSLFYRDSQGKMIPLGQGALPPLPAERLARILNAQDVLATALQRNLELRSLGSQAEQAEADRLMGINELLPKVDVNYEWSRDRGLGSSSLTSTLVTDNESRWMINVEIPIEYRKGLGRRQAGEAKLDQVKTKENFVKDKLRTESQALTLQLNSFAEIFSVTKDEVSLARELAQAEMRRFNKGASDLILVNLREEKLAEAQIKNLESLLSYFLTDAEVRRLKVEFYPGSLE